VSTRARHTPLSLVAQPGTRVLTYGTFDLFHIGHLRLLERLRALGDHLTVAVSTDEFNTRKGKQAFIPFRDRLDIVSSLRCVDAVIAEHDWAQKRDDIRRLSIDVFGMGDDWVGKFDDLGDIARVVYLERTPDISSSAIKQSLRAHAPDGVVATSPVSTPLARAS
jgi:glycerol-3-phosphate cytidylyltransferase